MFYHTVPPHPDSSWSVADKAEITFPSFKGSFSPLSSFFFFFFSQELKVKVLEQVQDQLSDILDRALIENNPPFIQKQLTKNGTTAQPSSGSGEAVYYHCYSLQ